MSLERVTIEAKTHHRPASCATHGDYTETGGQLMATSRVMWFGCPLCSKAAREAEELDAKRREEEDRQSRIERRLNAAGIPIAFRVRSFDNYHANGKDEDETARMEEAVRIVREFADNFWSRHYRAGTFLVLGGDRGTGKSHLAIAAAQQVMKRGTAMYARSSDLIRKVRGTWRRDSAQTEDEVLHLLGTGLDLLVIDEVGLQRGTEDEQIIMFEILDRRYADLRPTILLTNLEGREFAEFLGARIMDRLRERAVFVPFKWESYRGSR